MKDKRQRLSIAYEHLRNTGKAHTQKDIAYAMGADKTTISQALKGNENYLTDNFMQRFNAAFDGVFRLDWLLTGEGEMLNGQNIQNINNSGTINAQNGVVGQVHGDFHNNGSKDQVIEEQKSEISKMFEAIILAVGGFQKTSERHDEYVIRQDDYIKRQDEYIARIVNHSYLRNERNMERIDKVIGQQNELIRMVVEQSQRTQDRADRLLDLLEKKL